MLLPPAKGTERSSRKVGTSVTMPGSIIENIIVLKMMLFSLNLILANPYAAMEPNSRLVKIFIIVRNNVLAKYLAMGTFLKMSA